MNRKIAKLVNQLFMNTGDSIALNDRDRGYYSALNDLSVLISGMPLEPIRCGLDGCSRLFVSVGAGHTRKYCCNSHKTLAYLARKKSSP